MKEIINGGLIVAISLSALFIVPSCHKKNTSFDYNLAIETVHDYVEAQQMTDLLLNTYFKSITDSTLLADGFAMIDGANVNCSANPHKIVIDYTGWGRKDGYGHWRRGAYEATSETGFFDSLAIVNIAFNKFYYDNDSISVGNFSITNMGAASGGNYLFYVNATDICREFHDTTGQLNYQMQQGFLRMKDPMSPYHTINDYFKISGNLQGIAQNGQLFNSTVNDTNSMINPFSCRWLVGGITNVELLDFIHSATVDFSNNGGCLNQYSITTNGTFFVKAFDKKR